MSCVQSTHIHSSSTAAMDVSHLPHRGCRTRYSRAAWPPSKAPRISGDRRLLPSCFSNQQQARDKSMIAGTQGAAVSEHRPNFSKGCFTNQQHHKLRTSNQLSRALRGQPFQTTGPISQRAARAKALGSGFGAGE